MSWPVRFEPATLRFRQHNISNYGTFFVLSIHVSIYTIAIVCVLVRDAT